MNASRRAPAKDPILALGEDLKRGEELFPVFLFAGEDFDSMELALAELESAFSPQEKIVLSGFEHPLSKALEHGMSVSMFSMGAAQLVLVRHAEAYQGRKSQSAPFAPTEAELAALERYLNSPSRDVLMVFMFNTQPPKPKKRGKDFYSLVSKHAKSYEFNLPRTTREATQRAASIFKQYGLVADAQIVSALVDECGTDTAQMRQSIEKIFLYLGAQPNQRVTAEALEQVVIHTKLSNIYALQDAFATGDMNGALLALHDILRQKEFDSVRILVYLQIRIREIYSIAYRLHRNASPREISASAGRRAWLVDKLIQQARRHSLQTWEALLNLLYQTDVRIKSSPLPAEALIEEAVISGCQMLAAS